ncbi:unnamed protein product, partial [Bubo scandiacus]
MTAKKGETVTFRCVATFDPGLASHGLEWRRDGRLLGETADSDKYSLTGDTLTVAGVDYADQGTFSCRAWTLLDAVEAEARLRVVGEPAGPCAGAAGAGGGRAPGPAQMDPGRRTQQPRGEVRGGGRGGHLHARALRGAADGAGGSALGPPHPLALRPLPLPGAGGQRLRAGGAQRPQRPHLHPPPRPPSATLGGSRVKATRPTTWSSPGSRWRRASGTRPRCGTGCSGGRWSRRWAAGTRRRWGAPPVVVGGTPTFSPYEIRVQAVNDAGKGPEPPVIVGYSGEDLPLVYPENVGVEILNSTSVRVRWSLAGARQDLRGHLRGFR